MEKTNRDQRLTVSEGVAFENFSENQLEDVDCEFENEADLVSSDHVRVVIRCRPLNTTREKNGRSVLGLDPKSNTVEIRQDNSTPKTYRFTIVADESRDNAFIFQRTGRPIVECALAGFNGAIVAYGQTGSGKTFTMQGTSLMSTHSKDGISKGLTQSVCETIFEEMREMRTTSDSVAFSVSASYLEIYNEVLIDLLTPQDPPNSRTPRKPAKLTIREDSSGQISVNGLSQVMVDSPEACYQLLIAGAERRTVGSTNMNTESSRSHSVFTLSLEKKDSSSGIIRASRLHLVDLAGSERQKGTGATGIRLREAGGINKSLSALGNVINALSAREGAGNSGKGSRHPSCRDSKLTFLLKDALGGNAKLCLIATISPALSSIDETISTLEFARRCAAVRNEAVINESLTEDVAKLQSEVRRLKLTVSNLTMSLAKARTAEAEFRHRCSSGMSLGRDSLSSSHESPRIRRDCGTQTDTEAESSNGSQVAGVNRSNGPANDKENVTCDGPRAALEGTTFAKSPRSTLKEIDTPVRRDYKNEYGTSSVISTSSILRGDSSWLDQRGAVLHESPTCVRDVTGGQTNGGSATGPDDESQNVMEADLSDEGRMLPDGDELEKVEYSESETEIASVVKTSQRIKAATARAAHDTFESNALLRELRAGLEELASCADDVLLAARESVQQQQHTNSKSHPHVPASMHRTVTNSPERSPSARLSNDGQPKHIATNNEGSMRLPEQPSRADMMAGLGEPTVQALCGAMDVERDVDGRALLRPWEAEAREHELRAQRAAAREAMLESEMATRQALQEESGSGGSGNVIRSSLTKRQDDVKSERNGRGMRSEAVGVRIYTRTTVDSRDAEPVSAAAGLRMWVNAVRTRGRRRRRTAVLALAMEGGENGDKDGKGRKKRGASKRDGSIDGMGFADLEVGGRRGKARIGAAARGESLVGGDVFERAMTMGELAGVREAMRLTVSDYDGYSHGLSLGRQPSVGQSVSQLFDSLVAIENDLMDD